MEEDGRQADMASADYLKTAPVVLVTNNVAMMQVNDLFPVQLYTDLAPPSCPHCQQPGMELADIMICKGSPMQCDMFETLVERGWWRIGADVLFKMKLADICCPTHFARIPVTDFKVTKSQKHVLRKWQKFLLHGDPRWDNPDSCQAFDHQVESTEYENAADAETEAVQQSHQPNDSPQTAAQTMISARDSLERIQHKTKKAVKPGLGPDPNKPLCRKAKVVKVEKRASKLGTLATGEHEQGNKAVENPPKKTAVALHELLDKYEAELQTSSPKHNLEIKLFSCNPEDSHTTDAIDAAFHIYISHMKAVLPEQVTFDTVSEFRRGFVDSPFISTQGDRPMGTYHLHYCIDGKLEMFTVGDILPKSYTPIQTYTTTHVFAS